MDDRDAWRESVRETVLAGRHHEDDDDDDDGDNLLKVIT